MLQNMSHKINKCRLIIVSCIDHAIKRFAGAGKGGAVRLDTQSEPLNGEVVSSLLKEGVPSPALHFSCCGAPPALRPP